MSRSAHNASDLFAQYEHMQQGQEQGQWSEQQVTHNAYTVELRGTPRGPTDSPGALSVPLCIVYVYGSQSHTPADSAFYHTSASPDASEHVQLGVSDEDVHGDGRWAAAAPASPSRTRSRSSSQVAHGRRGGDGSSYHGDERSDDAAASTAAASAGVLPSGPVTLPSSSGSGLLRALTSSRWSLPLLYLFFVIYHLVGPFVLVLLWYLDFVQLVVSIVFALGIPLALYHLLWKHDVNSRRQAERERRIQAQAQAIAQGSEPSSASASVSVRVHRRRVSEVSERVEAASASLGDIFAVVSRHYVYELYQLALTLLSCACYIAYSYNLRFDLVPAVLSPDGGEVLSPAHGSYTLRFRDSATYVQVEYFLMVSLSLDYLLRLHSTPPGLGSKWRYIASYYSLVDLGCFSVVAYGSFWHRQLAPPDATYNIYLLQAPFRFLRLRRALQSLDEPVRRMRGVQEDVTAIYRLGPLVLSRRTTFLVLLVLKVVLFLCSAAALVLALEFPCEALVREGDSCAAALQRFHVTVYFIVVTLSTVGYGDITCGTDAGRVLMTCIIIYAVVLVPREAQAFMDLDAQQKKIEEEERERTRHDEAAQVAAEVAAQAIAAVVAAPPAAATAAEPVGALPSSSSSSPSGSVLPAFLADDRALLHRWAALQLAHTCAQKPGLAQRLSAVLKEEGAQAQPPKPKQAYSQPTAQQCAELVRMLFGNVSDEVATTSKQ